MAFTISDASRSHTIMFNICLNLFYLRVLPTDSRRDSVDFDSIDRNIETRMIVHEIFTGVSAFDMVTQ